MGVFAQKVTTPSAEYSATLKLQFAKSPIFLDEVRLMPCDPR
jgi:hypothetical protein